MKRLEKGLPGLEGDFRVIRKICFVTFTFFFLVSAAWEQPSVQALALPFEKRIIYEGQVPGLMNERVVTGGKIENSYVEFRQPGRANLFLPWTKVKAVLPILPEENSAASLEEFEAGFRVLEACRLEWPNLEEVSNITLIKWQDRIRRIHAQRETQNRALEEQQKKREEEEMATAQKLAFAKAEAEMNIRQAKKKEEIEWIRKQVDQRGQFKTRQEIEKVLFAIQQLDVSDREKITDLKIASEYWNRCKNLPSNVEMPGSVDDYNLVPEKIIIDPSALGSLLRTLAWLLFMFPLIILFHGLNQILDYLKDGAWISAGMWALLVFVSGGVLYALFFYKPSPLADTKQESATEMRQVWAVLANLKTKKVTRFEQKNEIHAQSLLEEIFQRIRNPDTGSSSMIPELAGISSSRDKTEIEIKTKISLKWLSLPVSLKFETPVSSQDLAFTVTRGKVGPFPVSPSIATWLWEQAAPVYQSVGSGLGLDQGVKFTLISPEKVMVTIPEVHSSIKKNP